MRPMIDSYPGRKGISRLRRAATLLVGCLLIGQPGPNGPASGWDSPFGRGHPLAGKIWDVAAGSSIDAATLVERLAASQFVLLGEKHDNSDHHRLQAWLLRALIAADRRPAVGFEMFTVEDTAALARHLAEAPTDAAGLADVVDWDRSGWPAWALYQPIVEAAIEVRLPILGTNIAPSTLRALKLKGLAALEPSVRARLGLDRPLDPGVREAMAVEIGDAHCGYASQAAVEAMITIQQARDAQMAESLAAADGQDGAVLIAGFGHVRKDRGIPPFLTARHPGAAVSSVAFLEVDEDTTAPEGYAAQFGQETLPFDYLWFTPRVDEREPCARFRKELKRLRQRP